MPTVYVKAAQGRVAFTAPRNGRRLSNTEFVPVQQSDWINSLIASGDVEIRPQEAPAGSVSVPESEAPRKSKRPRGDAADASSPQ